MKNGKIIRREDADNWRTSQDLLAQAKLEVENMRIKAQERALAEELRGYTTGLEHARTEQSQIVLETILRRDVYFSTIEADLVDVVMNAVRKIFADFSDIERVKIVLAKALSTLRNQTQATVSVHPSQYEALKSSVDVLISSCPHLRVLTVESDSRINPGTCVLSSDISIIETDLEAQIRAIEYSLAALLPGPA